MGLFELSKEECSSGGALLENMASNGDPTSFLNLSTSMQNFCKKNKDCNFSFSGLVSSVFRSIENELKANHDKIRVANEEKIILKEKVLFDLSAAVQSAITVQLVIYFVFRKAWKNNLNLKSD